MKNRLLLLFMLLLATILATKANPVDMRTAREVAVKFLNANTKIPLRGIDDLQLATIYKTESGIDAFHIFNTPNGFVIVSADDCAIPILGYSDEGRPFDLDNVPIQLQGYLQGFVEQIEYGIENHSGTDLRWELVCATGRLNNNRDGDEVGPLITANWGQGCYYNAMCPEDENGQCGHVPTGCVATAMGMIMHYWGFPTHGNGSHTYTPYGYPAQTANFSETTYNWGNMPDQLTETSTQAEIDAVSTLLWHCGVSMDMGYAVGGSGAFVQDMRVALNDVFNYDCNQVEELGVNQYVTTTQWFAKIKSNLDEGMPILYSGSTSDYLGHAWVCDGYNADSLLHFNWGWGGVENGYFAIGASNVFNWEFNEAIQTIFDIHPQCDASSVIQITAYVNDTIAGYVIGDGEYGCEHECTLTAVANEGYHFVKWIEFRDDIPSHYGEDYTVSIDSNYTFFLTHDRWLTAVFVEDGAGCNLVFDIYDSGGDGLNGGGLEVYYGDGSWERLSFGSGFCASFTREFLNNSHVMTWWSLGNGWGEYSYVVRFENGAEIHHNYGITEYFTFNHYEFDLNCEDQFTPRSITADVNPENSGIVTGGGVYNPGDTCTLSAVPNEGHSFAYWEENGEIISTETTMTFIVGIIDRHFMAHFGPYQIALSSNLEEGGYVNGGGTFDFGDICTIHAVPNEGYVFMYWTENDNVVSCSDEYSFVVMNDLDLVAVFATEDSVCNIILYFDGFNWKGHAMTVNYGNNVCEIIAPEEWTSYPSYSRYVYDGNHITISWTNGGYTWGWSFDVSYGNGTAIYHGFWNDCLQFEFDVNCDWAYVFYDIAVVESPTEGGTVYGTGSFHWGTTCTLTATPNEGYDFLYWSENGILVSWNEQYAFTVNENRHLVAHFGEQSATYCNMVFELGGDDIWIPGNLLKINYGDGVTEQLTTEWDQNHFTTGYACFSRPIRNGNQITLGFVEDGSYTYCVLSLHYEDGDTTYKITGLDNNFHCVFNVNCEDAIIDETYSITVTANYGDGGSVEGGGQYSFGQVCTLTATPEENCIFAYWAKDGIFVSYSPTYSFNAVENANYEAVFMKGVLIGKNFTGMGTGLPSESIANYSFSKQIYTFDEIAMSGVIESIAFYSSETAGHPKTRNYEVFLAHAYIDSFDSGDVLFSEEDMVFSGEVTMGVDRWSVIELSTPFYYNGIDNFVLLVIDNTNIQDGGLICRVFDTEECQAISGWSDETPFSVSNRDCGRGLYYKNQMFFGGEFTTLPPHTVDMTASPETGGTVSGAGTYEHGTRITVTACPNEGFFFKYWTENDVVVSAEASYTFFVKNDRVLMAHFGEDGIIAFADENVKNICVEYWDTNGDGELSYAEAAAVTTLDYAFQWNSVITSFDELQYFVGLTAIEDYGFFYCSGLTTIIIPISVTSIGSEAFSGCSGLEQIIVDSGNMAYDSREGCNAIINTSTNQLIAGCKNTVIPSSVISIGNYAFSIRCGLISIVIPSSVTSIGDYAFLGCIGMTSMIVLADNPPELGWGTFIDVNMGILVNVPCGSLSAYQNAEGWNEFTNFIEMCEHVITVTANPYEGGMVTGEGSYVGGQTCTLTATASDGYSFFNWTKEGIEVSTNEIYSFTVIENASFVANFELSNITQTTNFNNGWTWWSSYIETAGNDVLNQLKDGLGASGIIIKSQTQSTMHVGSNWFGTLPMNNEGSYMVKATAIVSVDITGPAATPENHPISLNSGWTWIGYPSTETMTVAEALANHTPQANDVIKGQSASAIYMAGQWRGSLTLTPGIGLMYKSNNSEAVTFTYATPSRMGATEINTVEPHWNANYSAYPTNMTVLAVVELDGKELAAQGPDANYELAAFANGECRGSVSMMYVEPLDRYMALLTIAGEETDQFRFALYNTETGEEYHNSDEILIYETDGVVGSPEAPLVIRFRGTIDVDEWVSSLQIFPNPVEHGQTISLGKTDELGEVQVEIINALGMVVETWRAASLQRITVPKVAGVYTLRITVEGKGTCYRKLVVR